MVGVVWKWTSMSEITFLAVWVKHLKEKSADDEKDPTEHHQHDFSIF